MQSSGHAAWVVLPFIGLLLSIALIPGSGTIAQSLQKVTITYASHDPNQNAPTVAPSEGSIHEADLRSDRHG